MLQPLKHWRKVVSSSINIKKWFLNLIRGITVILSNHFIHWDIIRTCWKLKTNWYLQRKINFKLLIKNQLDPAWRAAISKMFGYLFFSALDPQPNISTLSTLVFFPLQKFEFALYLRYCCTIRAWSSDFNPSCYLQLWIVCVH